jgi:hypothetical protein
MFIPQPATISATRLLLAFHSGLRRRWKSSSSMTRQIRCVLCVSLLKKREASFDGVDVAEIAIAPGLLT